MSQSNGIVNGVATPLPSQPHILIIGAGISGLLLAQSLKKSSILFTIFERDPNVTYRGRGWGLTIHWGLETFLSLLPQTLIDSLSRTYVDPDASCRGENGNFIFFDLKTGVARWKVPPAKRIRVSRERLRALLLEGLDVRWSKTFIALSTNARTNTITATFADGTSATGTLLIGADGSRSRVRPALMPPSRQPLSKNTALPIRILGATVTYRPPLALKLRALDPFFFQGGDPDSDTFLYFSFLSTPSSYLHQGKETEEYECQMIISWPYRKGWRGREQETEAPESDGEKVRFLKEVTSGWGEPFREMVQNMPQETEMKSIRLEDWVPRQGVWRNEGGRASLVGDAAHAMTMFRGEGANHAIADVAVLVKHLLPALQEGGGVGEAQQEAITAYEEEMIQRAGPAVLTSRKACMDAHDYRCINDQSPLVSKRVMVTQE